MLERADLRDDGKQGYEPLLAACPYACSVDDDDTEAEERDKTRAYAPATAAVIDARTASSIVNRPAG